MRKILLALSVVTIISACDKEEIILEEVNCNTPATVRDLTDLDGCGFVIELDNGEYLEPIFRFWCGTPPISEETLNDPLHSYSFIDGQRISLSYDIPADYGSICMIGTPVFVTCIQNIARQTTH